MSQSTIQSPSFNLWTEPWITIEQEDGGLAEVGIEQILSEAHKYHSLYDPSPLVIVGIHRLLIAILQSIHNPQTNQDLAKIWRTNRFADESIQEFGTRYAHCFDLFSENAPFLQSADLPLSPPKRAESYVVTLMDETPSGTATRHYNHINEEDQIFCSVCAAKGLALVPSFSKATGQGYRTSITGVPPLYLIPGGRVLFHSLVASLLTRQFQPKAAHPEVDTPWWNHSPIVTAKLEMTRIGYVQSLTLPSRKVRLHPMKMTKVCDRCGNMTAWAVRTIAYAMGEYRPKEATFWQDPFVAYKSSSEQKSAPSPVYMPKGQDVWREFAAIFLSSERTTGGTIRPSVIDQIVELQNEGVISDEYAYPFRVIGMRIDDMKAKVTAWSESGFEIPPRVLAEPLVASLIENGIEYTTECAKHIARTFRHHFGGDSSKSEKHQHLRQCSDFAGTIRSK